jgi:hypothetical protein
MTCWDADVRSEGCLIGVPQWLQNVDLKGIRFPHREQNEPEGSDEVSLGIGATGVFSVILPKGRAVSIFFFAGRVVVAPPCARVWTSPFFTGSPNDIGMLAGVVSLVGAGMRLLSFFAHSLHSRFLSPPACRTKVRTVWCFSPVSVMMASIKKWSRMAFSPASTFLIVERAMSCDGMTFFLLSVRMIRLLVSIASNEMDLNLMFRVSRIMDSSLSSSG